VNGWISLVRRDLRRGYGGGGPGLVVVFHLLVATLYPFAVGPDPALLSRTGGAVLWLGAVLAALLPVDRLLAPDHDAGVLDQLAARGTADELIAAAKLVALWLCFGPPLMLAALAGAALLGLSGATLVRLEIGLLLGTPGLAAVTLMVASVTLGLRGAGALAGLLLLPVAVPVVIFGAGSLGAGGGSGLRLLAATSLLLTAAAPFAAGAALRAARG
jgi:heme exporter protein B